MTYLFTKHLRAYYSSTKLFFLILTAFIALTSYSLQAQVILTGLTSNGGPQGKGTAFSISTTGENFSVMQAFADWGTAANGDLIKGDNGNFYGMTNTGGTYGVGTIFMMTPSGNITILKQLNKNTDGGNPYGELIKGWDGDFYGLTSTGGANGYGTIFKISEAGFFSVIKNFSWATDGSNPRGHLTLARDGNLYGITYTGGVNTAGTIFKVTQDGILTVIHHLNKTTDGNNSCSSLTEGSDGNLYGTTFGGGTYGFGTIFRVTTSGSFTVLHHLNSTTDGNYCESDLIQASDGNFYGMCYGGGTYGGGTIFRITPDSNFTVIRPLLSAQDGAGPYGNLCEYKNGILYGMTRSGGTKSAGTIFKISLSGSYSVLHSFNQPTEGGVACGGLIKNNDTTFYGLTSQGGAYNGGTVFKVDTSGVVTVLANFNGAGLGNAPYKTLLKGNDNAYYGTTNTGGAYNSGTIFKICGGMATVLHSFNKNIDGGLPKGGLIQASDGNFYGMTPDGGPKAYGTIYKITPDGIFSVVHVFNSSTEGGAPKGALVQGTDGNLYGMTSAGGPKSGGTIFSIDLSGTFTLLHSFIVASEGANPEGNLLLASDGSFYGLTMSQSHAFKVTAGGDFSVLHSFSVNTEGSSTLGSFIQAADSSLYAMSSSGGGYGAGTIFKMTTAGAVTILKTFYATTDGKNPKGDLLQAPDGNFYGTTNIGGTNNLGTIFRLTPSGNFTVLRHFNMNTDGGNSYSNLILAPADPFIANPQDIITKEDSAKSIKLTGSGGTGLVYNILSGPLHGTLTGTTSKKTYKPNRNYNGTDEFAFNVSSGCISSAPAIVHITVIPVGDAPVLSPIGNKSAVVNKVLKFTARASDADLGQVLTFSLAGAPAGAVIDATSGAFKWTPKSAGSFTFKVRVTDNDAPALYDEEQITVTVTNAAASMIAEGNLKTTTDLNISVFPNPVTDILHIRVSAQVKDMLVRIIDLKGTVISSYNFNNTAKTNYDINVSKLSWGIYLVQLQSGLVNETLKFMKD